MDLWGISLQPNSVIRCTYNFYKLSMMIKYYDRQKLLKNYRSALIHLKKVEIAEEFASGVINIVSGTEK